jgi:hypothetical protein
VLQIPTNLIQVRHHVLLVVIVKQRPVLRAQHHAITALMARTAVVLLFVISVIAVNVPLITVLSITVVVLLTVRYVG